MSEGAGRTRPNALQCIRYYGSRPDDGRAQPQPPQTDP
jgi:hypothetical protein